MATIFSLLQVAYTVRKRTRAPRICTTTINEDGVRDLTPDSDRTLSWSQIKGVELVDDDVFFVTRGGGIFVPASAFADRQLALDYYTHAVKLWQSGKTQSPGNLNIPSSSPEASIAPEAPGPPRVVKAEPSVEDLLAEDESEWIALEEEHKKRNPRKGTNT